MLIGPRSTKVIGQVGGLLFVEINNTQHVVLVTISVGHHRMRCKFKPVGLEHQMIGDGACRAEIFFQQGGRHGQRLARVVKARLIGRVNRKFTGGTNVDSCQITNGVIVFRVAEATRQHRAWITGKLHGLMKTHRANPLDDLLC